MSDKQEFIGDVIVFDHGSKTAICREHDAKSKRIVWSVQWRDANDSIVYNAARSYAHANAIFYGLLHDFWQRLVIDEEEIG